MPTLDIIALHEFNDFLQRNIMSFTLEYRRVLQRNIVLYSKGNG